MKKLISVIVTLALMMSVMPAAFTVAAGPIEHFSENFGAPATVVEQPLATGTTTGYNGWKLEQNNLATANSEGTYIEIEAEEGDSTNNVLRLSRTTSYDYSGTTQNLIALKAMPSISKTDSVKVSWKMKYTGSAYNVMWRGLFSEIRNDRFVFSDGTRINPDGSEQTAAFYTANVWHTYEVLINYTAGTTMLSVDGVTFGEPINKTYTVGNVELLMPRNAGNNGNVYIDDISVTQIPDPDWVSFEDISNGQTIDNVTQDLNLITTKDIYTIEWTSNNAAINAQTGAVTRHETANVTVTLTATVKLTQTGATLGTKTFIITVKPIQEVSDPGTVLFSENFGAPDSVSEQPVATSTTSGYNGWKLDADNLSAANSEGTYIEIEAEEGNASNNVLRIERTARNADHNHLVAVKSLGTIPQTDTVKLSWKMKYMANTHNLMMRGLFSDIRQDRLTLADGTKFEPADTAQTNALTLKEVWHTYEYVINYTAGTSELYVDSIKIGNTANVTPQLTKLELLIQRNANYNVGVIYVDDITVTHISDPAWVEFSDISNGQEIGNVTENLDLITTKDIYTIEWSSDNEAINAQTGEVIRPATESVTVTLTATIKLTQTGATLGTKPFIITVKPIYEAPDSGTVLYSETFGTPSTVTPQPLATSTTAGYNGWKLEKNNLTTANGQGTYLEIEAENETNNVLRLSRQGYSTDYENLIGMHSLPSILMKNKIKLSWRMKYTGDSYEILWRNTISEIRNDRLTLVNGARFEPVGSEQTAKLATKNVWHTYELLIDYTAGNTKLFVDDVQIGNTANSTIELKTIELLQPRHLWRSVGTVYFDDIEIEHIPDPVWIEFSEISNGQRIDNVTQNLTLPLTKELYTIEWSSSNTDIISNTGVVARPKLKDELVTLTAKIKLTSNNADLGTAEFNVTVPSNGTVIWSEDFDSATLGTHLVETPSYGFNGWKLDTRSAVSSGISTLERAVCEDTLLQIVKDPDDESNQALHMRRKLNVSYDRSPYDGGDPTNWIASKQITNITPINSGVVYLSGRLWLGSNNGRIWFEPFGAIRPDKWVTASNNYFNSGASYDYTPEEAALWKIQEWNTFGFLMNFDDHWTQFYVNGKPVGPQVFMTLTEFKDVSLYMPRNETGGDHYIDSISLKQANLTDLEWINMALDDVVLELDENGVTENIILPETSTYGTTISWSSSNTSIIANDGSVARPRGDNQIVTLTATVSKNGVSNTRDFDVVVKGYSEIEYISAIFDFSAIGNGQKEWNITRDLSIVNSFNGATITWNSSNPSVLTHNGRVTRSDVDMPVVYSATFTAGGSTFTRDFNLVIAGEGKVLAQEDFSHASTEGQDISGWHGWKLEDPNKDASIKAIIRKNVSDTLKSYEDAEKVLSFKRYLTAAEADVSNQKVMFGFSSIKPEIMRIDFDFMFKSPNTVLYLELNGMNRHYAISQKGIGLKARNVVPFDNELSANKWYHATIELDTYTNEFNLYLDYEKINDEPIYEPGSAYINGLNFYSNCVTATTHEEFLIRRIMVRDTTLAPEKAVANAIQALTLSPINYETGRLELPKYGTDNTRITWTSSDSDIISPSGVVTKPASQKTVTMKATVTKGNKTGTKQIPVTVNSRSNLQPTVEILNIIASQLTEKSITDEDRFRISKNLDLPKEITNGRAADIGGVDITWKSNYPSVINDEGEIFPQQYEVITKLTATLTAKTDSNITTTKDLKFAVDAGGEDFDEFCFDDMDPDDAGASVAMWKDMELREREGGTEYGTQFFADKAPTDRYLSYEDANEAMFLNRYTTAKFDAITALSHATVKKAETNEYFYGDVLTLSFKIQFQTPGDKLKTEIYCQQQRNIYVTPTSITMSQNTMEYRFPEPLALGEWHDFTFYYDMKSWRLDVYCNGEYLLSDPIVFGTGPYPYLNQWRFYNDSLGHLVIDDIRVRNIKLPDAEKIVSDAMEKVEIPSTVTENITLPSYVGTCAVTWRSSDEAVISDGGCINPGAVASKSATLTATFRFNNVVKKKTFNINVPAQSDYYKYEISDISFSGNTVSSVSLNKKLSGAESAKLLVMVYDCDEFINSYAFDIPALSQGETTSISTNINTGSTINLKVKAVVVDSTDNKIISNSHFYKKGE